MRIFRSLFLLGTVMALLTACGEPGSSATAGTAPEGDAEPAGIANLEAPEMKIREIPWEEYADYLERMYATSVGRYGPENVLDGDPETWWEAMPGAGVNEGIMLYFEKPVEVEEIRIVKGSGKSAISELSLYGDGANLGETKFGVKKKIGKSLTALFVRVNEMRGVKPADYYVDEGEGTVTSYPEDQVAAIAEIELYAESGRKLKVRPLHLVAGKVMASSTLSPAEAYSADFLFDSRMEFGWADGKDGSGTGEKLTFSFDENVHIEKIKIWNGYQRSDKHFSSNERAQEISFGKKGAAGERYTLPDEKAGAEIELKAAVEGREFELAIESIYPGKAYQDLVLSELRFFDGKRWFAMYPAGEKQRVAQLRQSIKGTVLENIADRNVGDEWRTDHGRLHRERSLILRSNGSFVLYLTDTERTGVQTNEITQVADGNWEISKADGKSAKVKIFGKIHRIKDKMNIYKGKSKSNHTRIFHEFITVDQGMVRGSKLLDSIRIGLRDQDMVACDKYAEVKVDLKYMSDDNFMEEYLYSECLPCMLREDAARALGEAEKALEKAHGEKYQFLIWDAYRPYEVQKMMWEKVSDPKYVADPYNGGSSHNKGAAIDLTLVDKLGKVLKVGENIDMGTEFDHFGEEAHHGYDKLTEEQATNRKILKDAMESAGFKILPSEWWHYSLQGNFPIQDLNQECDY